MISAKEWKAYNDGVAEISDKAEQEVIRRLTAWIALNPNATVAETREYAKKVMDAIIQSGGSLASSFAAKWYDHRAEREHVKLDQAVTAAVYSPERTDSVARYQAKKLVAGDFAGFAKACGEYARNDALRALNETIIANAKRDRSKGVRFARVTTGRETCTFCLMLASRGAVYHSRQSAGEFRHFHRNCDCKIVPGFEDDPMAELVQGHDPKVELRRWQRVESARDNAIKITGAIHQESELQRRFDSAWKRYAALGKTESAYKDTVARFVRELVPENPIEVEPFTALRGKEIMDAVVLAESNRKVTLRNPDKHKQKDGNTSDATVDGVTCDFKNMTSPKIKKMVREITSKLDRQGPSFFVDISHSNISLQSAEAKISALLDDPKIRVVYLRKGNTLEILKK